MIFPQRNIQKTNSGIFFGRTPVSVDVSKEKSDHADLRDQENQRIFKNAVHMLDFP